MSHFKVLVIGDDYEKQLAPYDENAQVDPYRDYEKGTPTEHWMFKTLAKEGLSADAGWAEFAQRYSAHYADGDSRDCVMFHDPEQDRAYTMTTYNPKSKWDWYSLGGRYRGCLLVKRGAVAARGGPGSFGNGPRHEDGVDQARVEDIDWAEMRRRQRMLAEQNIEQMRQDYEAKDSARNFAWDMSDEQIVATLADPEPWINMQSPAFTCYAVVKAGEWCEKGRMGWFGMASDEMTDEQWQQKLSELLANLDGETLLTIVDCHI